MPKVVRMAIQTTLDIVPIHFHRNNAPANRLSTNVHRI
jgi:hypothetical protein